MRGSLSYNMIPLSHDEILNVEPTNVTTNVSSNVYYGYQPRIHSYAKDSQNNTNTEQRIGDNSQMDIQFDNCYENNMQIESDFTRYVNRKRKLQETTNDDNGEFKKRRQSDFHFKELCQLEVTKKEENSIEEDILRETHGVNIYHWLSNED